MASWMQGNSDHANDSDGNGGKWQRKREITDRECLLACKNGLQIEHMQVFGPSNRTINFGAVKMEGKRFLHFPH